MEQQVAIPQSVTDRVWDLFTQDVVTVLALALAGVVIGIATVQGAKLGIRVFMGEPADLATRMKRALQYRFCGLILGAIYTLLLDLVLLDYSIGIRLVVGSASGLVAGGFTPRAYDAWHNDIWPWIERKFFGGGKPPDDDDGDGDETRTSFKGK